MIFTVSMKCPDALEDAIDEAVAREVEGIEVDGEDEKEALGEIRKQKIKAICSRWFEWGEYVHLEINTVAQTCTVKSVT